MTALEADVELTGIGAVWSAAGKSACEGTWRISPDATSSKPTMTASRVHETVLLRSRYDTRSAPVTHTVAEAEDARGAIDIDRDRSRTPGLRPAPAPEPELALPLLLARLGVDAVRPGTESPLPVLPVAAAAPEPEPEPAAPAASAAAFECECAEFLSPPLLLLRLLLPLELLLELLLLPSAKGMAPGMGGRGNSVITRAGACVTADAIEHRSAVVKLSRVQSASVPAGATAAHADTGSAGEEGERRYRVAELVKAKPPLEPPPLPFVEEPKESRAESLLMLLE